MKLNNYFNKKSFSTFGHGGNTVKNAFVTGLLIMPATPGYAVLAGVMALAALGQANLWQEEATGKPLWKPKVIKHLGL